MPDAPSRQPIGRSPSPTPSPTRPAPPAATSGTVRTCPCGRAEFHRCCYPVALRLRAGNAGRRLPASPFDEVRASSALMLWGLTAAADDPTSPQAAGVREGLSSAARRFWGAIAGEPSLMTAAPPDSGSAYGAALFERTWAPTDDGTRTWLLETLPPGLRYDAVVGELALDWLLWDAPWLRGEPAAAWFLQTQDDSTGARVRAVIRSLLRSRPGLYRLADPAEAARIETPGATAVDPAGETDTGTSLESARDSGNDGHDVPGLDSSAGVPDGPTTLAPVGSPDHPGLYLVDLLGGPPVRVDTPTPAWPHPERCLLVRTYRFGSWRLAAGEGLLLSAETVTRLLERIELDRRNQGVPGWPDPRRDRWLAGRLLPLAASLWSNARNSATVAPPPAGRYDVLLG